ncbi:MAG TPA: hypothetical protein PKA54_04765 [Chitinophagaceae bacterium]|nr:hypothetical protein [Chitinophagaceae bacterium]
MKKYTPINLLFLILIIVAVSSCRKSNNSKYYYNPLNDTISPQITISVPLSNNIYQYMDYVHIVGTVTDYETVKRGGKLASLSIIVDELNSVDSTFRKNLFKAYPDVDSKGGYTFNEKFMLLSNDVTPTFCRLSVETMDYINKFTRDTVYFSIQ